MLEAQSYSAVETLRNGCRVEIRALRPGDRSDLLTAVDQMSKQSLHSRFFGAKRGFSEKEISFFVDVDFINHVALVAVANEGIHSVIVGGGRYVIVKPGTAEVAFAVIDGYQGQGLAVLLMRHLVLIARKAQLQEFIADVLSENTPMLNVFERSGLSITKKRESQIIHLTLHLA